MIPLQLSLREFQTRPLRAILTLGSVVIGVAAIVAVIMTTDAAKIAQHSLANAISGNADLEIHSEGGGVFESDFLDALSEVSNVETVSPSIHRFVIMILPDDRKARVQMTGIDIETDHHFRSLNIVQGRMCESGDEVLLDQSLARSFQIEAGQDIRFLTASGIREAKVVGLSSPAGASGAMGGSFAMVTLPTAQKWFRSRNRVDSIQIAIRKNADPAIVQREVEGLLPQGIVVRPPTMTSRSAEETMIGIQEGLRMAIAFSFIIAVFIIYNTFQMNVGERRRQLGVLRALGTTRRELMFLVLREGLLIGVAGIFAGWLLGVFGAYLLCAAMEQVLGVPLPRYNVSPFSLIVSGSCGIVIMMLGAYFPARRAGSMPPSEAMRVISIAEMEPPSIRLAVVGLMISILGFSVMMGCVFGRVAINHSSTSAIVGLLGILLILPFVLAPLTSGVLWITGGRLGVIGSMARRQLLRHRTRSALTIGVLFMATCTGISMASTILDNIRDIRRWYERAIIGDFFIRAAMPDMASGQAADIPVDLIEQLKKIDGISRIDTLSFGSARSGESTLYVVSREFHNDRQVYFDLLEGDEKTIVEQVRQGGVVVSTVLAERNHLRLGQVLPIETKEGTKDFPIVGICNDYVAGGLTVYMTSANAKKWLGLEVVGAYVIEAEEAKRAHVESELRKLCDATGLMLQSYRELVTYIQSVTNGVVASLWVVLALGSLIAAFGLINTLAMSIQEQTREIGMLRVIAMTRGQVRWMVLTQAMMMAVIAILPGVPAGILTSYMVNLTTQTVTGHHIEFTWRVPLMIGAVLVGLIVVAIAALLPAERAVRLRPSEALQYE